MQNYLTTPTTLQLEISSMCNALCYGCIRTDQTNFNGKLPIIPDKKMLQLPTLKKIFEQFTTVKTLDFCGTVDDPFMHPHFNDILRLALDSGIKNIKIHTNGSIRDADYWKETAEILNQFTTHNLKFSIDGLRDTNHLYYRQRTNFDKIMKNAQAFIEAGGTAGWQYIIFPWNKHQIEEASKLSKEMGFKTFIHRIDRVFINKNQKGWLLEDVIRRKQENKPINLNQKFDWNDLAVRFEKDEDNTIDCHFKKEKMYFIDFNARLWPCCFLRNTEFGGHNTHWHQVKNIMYDKYDDPTWNRLDLHSVEEILNHPFYANDLITSFNSKYGMECTDKLAKCAVTYSVKRQEILPIAKHKTENNNN